MFTEASDFLEPLKILHQNIRDAVVAAGEEHSVDELSKVAHDEEGDTIFAVDRVSEDVLLDFFSREISIHTPLVLIAEGIVPYGKVVLPKGTEEADANWRVIMDPIDGTRGLMYQKRSAWILTGIAPNRGDETSLADIQVALQTEIPLTKQHLCDTLWAENGKGVQAERFNRITGERSPLDITPSTSTCFENGFATVARFFPGIQEVLGGVTDDWMKALVGPPVEGKAQCFEDQYISTGGQLYELMIGHDRLVADLRPLVGKSDSSPEEPMGLCSHPYDLCTELIAREAGILVCDEKGDRLTAPLDISSNVTWVGLANPALKEPVFEALQTILKNRLAV